MTIIISLYISSHPGWWFGCHQFYFPRNVGLLSSSQLTKSYFSEGWPWPTNQQSFDVSPEARIKELEQSPEYLRAKRFVEDPAAERERQRAELLGTLEAKAAPRRGKVKCGVSFNGGAEKMDDLWNFINVKSLRTYV